MDCASHPDRSAVAVCTRCDKPVCEECTEERNGRHFCDRCAQFVDRRAGQRPGAAAAPAAVPVPAPAVESRFGHVEDTSQGGTYPGQPAAAGAGEVDQAAAPGSLYQGPAAGDLYQGPPAGDVYQGPGESATSAGAHGGAALPAADAGTAQGEAAGSLGRGLVYGASAGVIAALVWYGVALLSDWKLGPIAALVGWAVGLTTAFGAGRRGGDVALLSVALALASMMGGEYLLWDHFYQQFAQEESEYLLLLNEIGRDGRFSEDDLRRYYEWGDQAEDWGGASYEELSRSVKSDIRLWLRDEYDELVRSKQPEELASGGSLPFQEFLGYFVLDFWNVVFFLIGAGAAFKMGLGGDD